MAELIFPAAGVGTMLATKGRPARLPHFLFLLITSLGLVAGSASAQPGDVILDSFDHGGQTRQYKLYVPAAYDGSEPWPLVISYHGYTSDMDQQIELTTMNVVADTAGFLVAYPQGLTVTRYPGDFLPAWLPASGPGWNTPDVQGAQDDVDFTRQVILRIQASHAVDEERIHAAGISMGAFMAFHAGCELSDLLASVAGVAAQPSQAVLDGCAAAGDMSRLMVHGTADAVVPYGGVAGLVPSVEECGEAWAAALECGPEPVVTELPDLDPDDESTVTVMSYAGCRDSREVLIYRVNNGGHGWPGPNGEIMPSFLGPVNHDMDAAVEILDFFTRNPRQDQVVAAAVDREGLPRLAAELEAYPNPFNPATTLRLALAEPGEVVIRIFDLRGRLVDTLAPGHLAAGAHEIFWDASRGADGKSLATGVYFARLEAAGQASTLKLLCLK
jgi:polyhydroxybutyrate depolymerase